MKYDYNKIARLVENYYDDVSVEKIEDDYIVIDRDKNLNEVGLVNNNCRVRVEDNSKLLNAWLEN